MEFLELWTAVRSLRKELLPERLTFHILGELFDQSKISSQSCLCLGDPRGDPEVVQRVPPGDPPIYVSLIRNSDIKKASMDNYLLEKCLNVSVVDLTSQVKQRVGVRLSTC